MKPVVMRDGGLVLSVPTEADIPEIVRWCQDPVAVRWMPALPQPYGVSDAEFFLNNIVAPGWQSGLELTWAIRDDRRPRVGSVATPDDEEEVVLDNGSDSPSLGAGPALGTVGIRLGQPGFRDGEVGYVVAPWARGRGLCAQALRMIARFAFASGGLNRDEIYWECEPGNVASWRAARNAGFRFDGVWPQDDAEHKPGNWQGSLRLGDQLCCRPEYKFEPAVIRPATKDDVSDVVALYKQLIGYPGNTWSDEYPNVIDAERDIGDSALFTAKVGDRLIGAISIGPLGDLVEVEWGLANPAVMARLAVAPPFHGYGYGASLVEFALAHARAKGYDGVALLVHPDHAAAITLYERFGFRATGEIFGWGHPWRKYELAF